MDTKPTAATGRMRMVETRQLRLALDGLLEALLAFDRQKNGWVWRGTDHTLVVEGPNNETVVVEARRDPSQPPQRMSYDRAFIAAALIHYCFLMRIPLPRGARKDLEVSPDGAALLLSQTLEGPGLHLVQPAAPAPSSGRLPPRR